MLNAKKATGGGGSTIPAMDPGTYPARLVVVAGLGLQKQRPYKGEPKDPKEELLTVYEFLDEFLVDEDGNEVKDKPRWLTDRFPFFNLNSEKAKSTKRYVALDPNLTYDGDWSGLIGTPCMVTISKDEGSNGKTYNNITNVSAMRPKEADKAADLVNEPLVFDPDEPDMEVFKKLPEWVQKIIQEGLEFKGSKLDQLLSGSQEHTEHEPEDQDEEDESW